MSERLDFLKEKAENFRAFLLGHSPKGLTKGGVAGLLGARVLACDKAGAGWPRRNWESKW